MDLQERIMLGRLLEQMEAHKDYSRKLGLKDNSYFQAQKEGKDQHV